MWVKSRVQNFGHQLIHWMLIPLAAVTLTLWPTVFSGLDRLQVDAGDTLLNLYFLEHAFQHLTTSNALNPELFWSPDFFWPIRDTLAWSDHLLGQSMIYGSWRSIMNPAESYLAWLATTLTLNYVAIRQACQRISPRSQATWISLAALLTSFSPTIIQQLGHPQLLSLFLFGPILWLCHRLINEQPHQFTLSDWLLLGTWLLANGFFNIYVFVYACFGTLVSTLVHLVKRAKQNSWGIAQGTRPLSSFIGFTTCVALNLIIYIPYLQTLKVFGKRPSEEILINLPKISSWFYGTSQWLLPPPITSGQQAANLITGVEQELFPGWCFCILLAAAIITAFRGSWPEQRSLRSWLLVIALMLIFSISVGGISIWPLISKLIPGASSLRASSRVGMGIVLFSAPAISLAASHWTLHKARTLETASALFALTGGLASISSQFPPSFSLSQWQREKQAVSQAVAGSDCDLFWYEWKDQPPWRAHVLAMHVQLQTGVPTANGYSGHFPRDNWPFQRRQGDQALNWIKTSNPEQFHTLKSSSTSDSWCIVSSIPNVQIRKHNPHSGGDWIPSVNKIIFQSGKISIGAKHGVLYLKNPYGKYPNEWVELLKESAPIRSKRGDFRITNVYFNNTASNKEIIIHDQNPLEGIEYLWRIDASTGLFTFQTLRPISKS